ncbi:MAG: class I SAM-dependent methyltransferase [Candidatus Brocadiia bacterium]|jgi:SAM-dependent methyltransferase|nr:class I SAM-dependent methyltransferase [Candidatus Brocadiia bacterium]
MKPDYHLLAEAYSAPKAAPYRRELDPAACREFGLTWPILSDPCKARRTFEPYRKRLEANGVSLANGRVLDVGCGTGVFSVYFVFCGARECVGVDFPAARLTVCRAFANMLPYGLSERLRPLACRIEDLAGEGPFDLIFCNEVISQLSGLDALARFHGLLADGGRLFISDGHNACNPWLRYRTQNLYRFREEGPSGRPGGRVIEKSYRQRRAELIAERFRGRLTNREAQMLAERTAGLYGEALYAACERYVREGGPPESYYIPDTAPVDPKTGIRHGPLLDPWELCERLKAAGFRRCEVYACLPGTHRLAPVAWLDRIVPTSLKLRVASGFMIAALR